MIGRLVLFTSAATVHAAEWSVLNGHFSAVSIGIAFKDKSTGWTTFTDGSSAPKIVKTTNGGLNWTAVNSSGTIVMPTGFAALHGASSHVASVGLLSNEYSFDGNNFKPSVGGPVVSQSIKHEAGRFVVAGNNGACHSFEGALFLCGSKAPLKYKGTGRYVSSPSKDVIYLTAGQWPQASSPPAPGSISLASHLRVRHSDGWMKARFEPVGVTAPTVEANASGYTAELWKSVDGGKTWKSLFSDEGSFYFNDISCFDDITCVAVGEGFGQDGSSSPGARVYVSTDGETFSLKHQGEDGSSLMAAKMLSKAEHWAGGTTKAGGLVAPVLALHSVDGGATWANDPSSSKVLGQMITAFDFVDGVGYATTVNALQISSLLKYA